MATYGDPPDLSTKNQNNELGTIDWVPISMTLVEYPKGTYKFH